MSFQPPSSVSTASEPTDQAQRPTKFSNQTSDGQASHTVPSTHSSEPTSTALGKGTTSDSTTESLPLTDTHQYSRSELDGEQMRAPGEGEVAAAVTDKAAAGGHGEERALEAGMEEKAEEHKEALHARGERTGAEIEEEGKEDWTGKREDVDVAAALEGRGKGVVLAAED